MTTYGPFYPSSVVNDGGGVAWANPGNAAGVPNASSATATIGSDEATSALRATGYAIQLPVNAVIQQLRFVPSPAVPIGLNPSAYALTRGDDLSFNGEDGFSFDNSEAAEPLTAEDIASIGWLYGIYNAGDSRGVSVESLPLYVDVA